MSEQTTFEEALDRLTGKQRAFVLAYLDCLNATEAARRAGYSARSLRQVASENLSKPDIKEVLRLGFERKVMPKEEVLGRLTMLASASLEDFITLEAEPGADDSEYPVYFQPQTPPKGKRKQISDEESDEEEDTTQGEKKPATPHPGHWRLDLAKAKRRGVLGALKKLKWGEYGPEIELHDPFTAQQAIGKHYRLFIERQEVSGPDGAPLVDTEALKKAAEELNAWRQQQTGALSSLPNQAPIVPTSATNTDS